MEEVKKIKPKERVKVLKALKAYNLEKLEELLNLVIIKEKLKETA